MSTSTIRILNDYHNLVPPSPGNPIIVPFLKPELISPKFFPTGNHSLIESDLMLNYCLSKPYIYTFHIDRLFQTLGCILTEHRVILISSNTDKLTCIILFLLSCLYPFRISHIIIPILPDSMLDYLELPSLYIDGINDENDVYIIIFRLQLMMQKLLESI